MNLPPFNTFPVLQNEELILREAQPSDIPSLLEILTYDGKSVETMEEGMRTMELIHQNYLDGDTVNWVIAHRSTRELIGFIGYYRGFENGVGELGFILKEAFRGKGYMSPSLRLAVEFGMNHMKLQQVIALTKPENEKAIGVLSRNGFSPESELVETYLKFVYSSE